jgi:hypothetical protein
MLARSRILVNPCYDFHNLTFCMKRLLAVLLFISLFGVFGVSLQARAACDCWCTSGQMGAQRANDTQEASTSETVQACRDFCDAKEEGFVGCYEEGLTPGSIGTCWTQYECDQQTREIDGEQVTYEWDGQHPNCLPGEGQCFAPNIPTDLIVSIGSVVEVKEMGEYFNALINMGIVAGTVVAILTFMVAGAMWMLARGNSGRIGQATGLLKRAVTGVILMLTMVAMAELISPGLVNWNPLRVPAVKQLSLLDPDSTCDALIAADFDISYEGGTQCGDVGTVEGIPDGVESTVVLGQECRFSTCTDDPLSHCIGTDSAGSDESGYTCVRCRDAFDASEDLGIFDSSVMADPSVQTCRSLESDELETESQKYFCEYYDAGLVSDFTTDSCVEFVYPSGSDYVDCSSLEGLQAGCRAYDQVIASYRGSEAWLFKEISFFEGADEDFALLGAICNDDPCDLKPEGESCELYIVDEYDDCDELDGAEYAACIAALSSIGTFANCGNTSSNLGVEHCLDKYGEEVDCHYLAW